MIKFGVFFCFFVGLWGFFFSQAFHPTQFCKIFPHHFYNCIIFCLFFWFSILVNILCAFLKKKMILELHIWFLCVWFWICAFSFLCGWFRICALFCVCDLMELLYDFILAFNLNSNLHLICHLNIVLLCPFEFLLLY